MTPWFTSLALWLRRSTTPPPAPGREDRTITEPSPLGRAVAPADVGPQALLLLHLFEHSASGLLLCDGNGRVRLCSPVAAALLAATPDQVCGHPVEDWITPLIDFSAGAGDSSLPVGQWETQAQRRDGTEFPVIWIGRILGSAREGSVAKLLCEPSSTSLRRVALRRNYMYSCPHVLYGPKCKASLTAATSTFLVESLTGNTVTLAEGWVDAERAPKYLGGMVRWDGQAGDIIRGVVGLQEGRRLVLNGATNELTVGDPVRVSLGCSHNFEIIGGAPVSDCADLHDNILNFGGQPFIPTENPIGTRVNLYY
jgi:hypothetical protein